MTNHYKLIHLSEPSLEFRYAQVLEDPRDGLTLFGPLDEAPHYGVRAGVIGPKSSIERFRRWAEQIQGPVGLYQDEQTRLKNGYARPPFPGFEAAFRVPWDASRMATIEVDTEVLSRAVRLDETSKRVYETVGIYAEPLLEWHRSEDVQVDIWFVVVPEECFVFAVRCPRFHLLSA